MAILSLNDILRDEVIQSLQGSDLILSKTITDLTPKVKVGSNTVTIPNVVGLSLSNVVAGTRATSGGMTTTGDALLLSSSKQVPEYISYADGMDSAVDLEAAFISVAPRVFAQGLEAAIATSLVTASSLDFDSVSAVAGVFAITDIAKAKKKLDGARVPKSDRYMAVNADGMEVLASMQEFQDGQKSLSPEALREGVVSMVKGFKVVQSEDIAGTGATLKVCFYHKSAVAFALHSAIEYIKSDIPEYAQFFIALRGKYGVKDVENVAAAGVRKITMSCTTATA